LTFLLEDKNGPGRRIGVPVDKLEEIPGIGPATLEKIEPFATV
jgi:DNA uptake protein ComE-like DNA-binding protein